MERREEIDHLEGEGTIILENEKEIIDAHYNLYVYRVILSNGTEGRCVVEGDITPSKDIDRKALFILQIEDGRKLGAIIKKIYLGPEGSNYEILPNNTLIEGKNFIERYMND